MFSRHFPFPENGFTVMACSLAVYFYVLTLFIEFFFFFAVNRVIFNKGARIECGSQFTTTIVTRANYPWFNPRCMRMHLNDPGCRPYVNNTHVSFKFPLGACGSRHITSSRKVIFTNRVLIVNKPDYKEGGEKSIMEIHFYCKYRRTDSPNHKTKGFL